MLLALGVLATNCSPTGVARFDAVSAQQDAATSGSYIRYNLAGYLPTARKIFVVLSSTNQSGATWTVKDSGGNTVSGGTGTVSASVSGLTSQTNFAYNHKIDLSGITALQTPGTYSLTVGSITPAATFVVSNNPYGTYATDIMRYFYVERSGTSYTDLHGVGHPNDNHLPIWRPTSSTATTSGTFALMDSPTQYADMLGGYYDAGDYIKFTLTNAFTVYLMLKSYEANPNMFVDSNWSEPTGQTLVDILDAAKFGLDYLLKTYPVDGGNDFYIQVANGNDHVDQVDFRLPDNDPRASQRMVFSVLSKPHMGMTAAALAKGAQIFASIPGYSALATTYKNKAQAIIDKANSAGKNGPFWDADPANDFYKDDDYVDNMALGNWEVGMALANQTYKNTATALAPPDQGFFYWNSVAFLANLAMGTTSTLAQAKMTTDLFATNAAGAANSLWGVTTTAPSWGSMQEFTGNGGAFGAYYRLDNTLTNYKNLAQDQLDYLFGRNNWGLSFLASQNLSASADKSYNQIYRVQNVFPRGVVSGGPASQGDQTTYCTTAYGFVAQTPEPTAPFNATDWSGATATTTWTFLNNKTDFVHQEMTISGDASALWLMANGIPQLAGQNYTVTVNIPDGHGTATGAGSYAAGSNVSVTFSPSTGYILTGVTRDGVAQPTGAATITNLQGNTTITASFTSVAALMACMP